MDAIKKHLLNDWFVCKCGTYQSRYDFLGKKNIECFCCKRKVPKENSKEWRHSKQEKLKKRTPNEKKEISDKLWREMSDDCRFIFAKPAIIKGKFAMVLPSWD